MPMFGVWEVFAAAMLTAVATGLGALPFVAAPRMDGRWVATSNALAAGLMLAACHSLIVEGYAYDPVRTLVGMVLGAMIIAVAHRVVEGHKEFGFASLKGADARKALMIVGIMTVHSAAEGVGVGVSFGGGEELGFFITAAIAIHNIPEGLAICLVLVPRGASVARAAGWSVFSSLPQPLLAVPAFLFVTAFEPVLPLGLGLAAGAMIWMTFAELIPDALKSSSNTIVAATTTTAMALMLAFQELVLKG